MEVPNFILVIACLIVMKDLQAPFVVELLIAAALCTPTLTIKYL